MTLGPVRVMGAGVVVIPFVVEVSSILNHLANCSSLLYLLCMYDKIEDNNDNSILTD